MKELFSSSEKDWTGNAKSAFATLGASNHSETAREAYDYYATEPKAAELLLQIEPMSNFIWECACGEGHLSKVFQLAGKSVKSSDICQRGFGEAGVDFLAIDNTEWIGDIVTNPPYKYAQEFVEKALQIIPEGNKVIMFLKLQFLESKGRKSLFLIIHPKLCMYHQVDYYVQKMVISKQQPKTEAQ